MLSLLCGEHYLYVCNIECYKSVTYEFRQIWNVLKAAAYKQ